MAIYSKRPTQFNIPTRANRYNKGFLPFAGLELNDNPLLNTENSASGMLNMVVDDNMYLTLRPRLIVDEKESTINDIVKDYLDTFADNKARVIADIYRVKNLTLVSVAVGEVFDTLLLLDDYVIVKTYTYAEFPNLFNEQKWRNDPLTKYLLNFDSFVVYFKNDNLYLVNKHNAMIAFISLETDTMYKLGPLVPYVPTYKAAIVDTSALDSQIIHEDLNILSDEFKVSVAFTEDLGLNLDIFERGNPKIDGYAFDQGDVGTFTTLEGIAYRDEKYIIYFDAADVKAKIIANTAPFNITFWLLEVETGLSLVRFTLNVLNNDSSATNGIKLDDLKKLWRDNRSYDSNGRLLGSLIYDPVTHALVRAYTPFKVAGVDIPPLLNRPESGQLSGYTYKSTNRQTYTDIYVFRIANYTFKCHNAAFIRDAYREPSTSFPLDTKVWRHYYFDGRIVVGIDTVSNTGINGRVGFVTFNIDNGDKYSLFLDTYEVMQLNDNITSDGIKVSNVYKGDDSEIFAITAYTVKPLTNPKALDVNYYYGVIKSVVYTTSGFVIISNLDLAEFTTATSTGELTEDNTGNYAYISAASHNSEISVDVGIKIDTGTNKYVLGESYLVGTKVRDNKVVLYNYLPGNYVYNSIDDRILSFDVFALQGSGMVIRLDNIYATEKITIRHLNLTPTYNVVYLGIDSKGYIRFSIPYAENTGLAVASKARVGGTLDYNGTNVLNTEYDYIKLFNGKVLSIKPTKNLIEYTYKVEGLSPIVFGKDVLERYRKYRALLATRLAIRDVVNLMTVDVVYGDNVIFVTQPNNFTYFPMLYFHQTRNTIRHIGMYARTVGVVYEKNALEFITMETNPFISEGTFTNFTGHQIIPLFNVHEQLALDYLDAKHLVTFFGETVYLNSGGLYMLSFEEGRPQDDMRKATLLSRVVNRKLLKENLSTAILANSDPYVLIMFPLAHTTNVYAFRYDQNAWYYWELPVKVLGTFGDNIDMKLKHILDGRINYSVFTEASVVVPEDKDIMVHSGNVERYMDFDRLTIPWYWKSQILALGSVTKSKQVTDTYFIFSNPNANFDVDTQGNFDVINNRITRQQFGIRYYSYNDIVTVAPKVEYEGTLNVINNLHRRTYLHRFNYCQIVCYNIDKDNPIQDKVRLVNINVVYKYLTGGK